MCSSTHCCRAPFGAAPTLVAVSSPFLNSIKVGMPRTPNLPGVPGFSSMLILMIPAPALYLVADWVDPGSMAPNSELSGSATIGW